MIIRHVAVERTRTTSCNGFPTGHVTYRDSLILSPPRQGGHDRDVDLSAVGQVTRSRHARRVCGPGVTGVTGCGACPSWQRLRDQWRQWSAAARRVVRQVWQERLE